MTWVITWNDGDGNDVDGDVDDVDDDVDCKVKTTPGVYVWSRG